ARDERAYVVARGAAIERVQVGEEALPRFLHDLEEARLARQQVAARGRHLALGGPVELLRLDEELRLAGDVLETPEHRLHAEEREPAEDQGEDHHDREAEAELEAEGPGPSHGSVLPCSVRACRVLACETRRSMAVTRDATSR